MNTHNLVIDFGKHKGTLWTRVPVSYLLWIASQNEFHPERKDIALAELNRRGSSVPEVDVSGHAIDRASEHSLAFWQEDKNTGEGFHSWLCRVAIEAYRYGAETTNGRKIHPRFTGLEFAFETDTEWPVVKTIIRKDKKDQS